jgi:hypothetical protein
MQYQTKAVFVIEKDNKKVQIIVDTDMPLGLLFDAVMEFKGYVVDRMVNAHKDEETQAEKQMPKLPCEDPKEQAEEQKAEDNGSKS